MTAPGQDKSERDFSARLVGGIKAAMGKTAPGTPVAPAPPRQRALYLAGGAAMLALWGLSLMPAISNWNNPNEDGFRSSLPSGRA